MTTALSVCVYCGAAGAVDEVYRNAAEAFGAQAAEQGLHLVYGGGRIGLMGLVADSALAAGGTVTGIIPRFLAEYEVEHQGLSELIVVETMHERKQAMVERADAFVVLPGGLGTLDETFEILTWKQLGLHSRPIVLLNIDGYWDPLLALIDHMIGANFAKPAHADLFCVSTSVAGALAILRAARTGVGVASDLI